MEVQDKILGLFVNALGMNEEDLQGFGGRIKFQKAIYLLQQEPFNFDFGFRYNLYIRGPYSPDLAQAGYRLLENTAAWRAARHEMQLKSESQGRIRALVSQFEQQPSGLDAGLLELAATIHFLVNNTFRHLASDERITAAKEWIETSKSGLADRFDEGLQKLRDLEMLA